MSDTKWMTYAELAEALGIGADSARNLVRRKRWPRQAGNDGLARVGVPVEYISENAKPDAPAEPPTNAPIDGGSDGGIVITVLANHISRLEVELEALKKEREAERDRLEGRAGALEEKVATLEQDLAAERIRAAQVDALNAIIAMEKQRAEELKAERDKWASALEASQRQITQLTEKQAEKRRFFSWLKRVG
jgi:cell division septum initiation protein DivIVA